jgi:hypothetical protein
MRTRSGSETVDAAPASELLDHTTNHNEALDSELIAREFGRFVPPPMSSL